MARRDAGTKEYLVESLRCTKNYEGQSERETGCWLQQTKWFVQATSTTVRVKIVTPFGRVLDCSAFLFATVQMTVSFLFLFQIHNFILLFLIVMMKSFYISRVRIFFTNLVQLHLINLKYFLFTFHFQIF